MKTMSLMNAVFRKKLCPSSPNDSKHARGDSPRSPRGRLSRALAVGPLALAVFALVASCAGERDDLIGTPGTSPSRSLQTAEGGALFYDHPDGFCSDLDPNGVPYTPARPTWATLAGTHYDGIVHPNGAQSIRYPDYQNISHNLSVIHSLQSLLSLLTNITGKIEGAQTFLEEGQYVDAVYGAIPQVTGHCVCIQGGCNPDAVFQQAQNAVEELLNVYAIEQLLTQFLTEKVDATIADFNGLVSYFQGLISPSGGVVTTLEQLIYQAIDDEITNALNNTVNPAASACHSAAFSAIDKAAAIEAAVVEAINELRDELLADFAAIQSAIELATGLPSSVIPQIKADIEYIRSFFEGVSSFDDLFQLDWGVLADTLSDAVPFYTDAIEDVQAAIEDVTGVWNNVTNFQNRIEQLADDIYAMVISELQAAGTEAQACIDAILAGVDFVVGYDPTDFAANLTEDILALIEDTWEDALDEVQSTLQGIIDRIQGVLSGEEALALFTSQFNGILGLVTSTLQSCYTKATRPDCYDFCGASSNTDFLWMPVDFLNDPQALAAGVANGAMFALEQTGWLDQIKEWVSDQMESDVGAAFTGVLSAIGDLGAAVQKVIDFLGSAFEYIDHFTEGYHLGAYSDLRPDLHMCIGYAGHGAYAQFGNLGGDRFSIGARYSSHNLSRQHRIHFRSGGFAVSAFGYDLSLAPTIEVGTQMDGWRLWDVTRPFGIPIPPSGVSQQDVDRFDVFNVMPRDRFPFRPSDGPISPGSFVVRDLYPSRPNASSLPQWPRPNVNEPWEGRSIAVTSLGLNLKFDYPAQGKEYFELAEIDIIPRILVVIPYLAYSFGVEWQHETNYMRERIREKINQNLLASEQLTAADFERNMHAMQAPDLSADNGTSIYVEPEIGLEAFLGFRIWKIKIGAGARLGLALNIRPGGFGGVVDLNAALADALTSSNPASDATCEPIWSFTNQRSCSNDVFTASTGNYSCDASSADHSCCVSVRVQGESSGVYRMCVDDWTGINAEICEGINIVADSLEQAQQAIGQIPDVASSIRNRLMQLIDGARQVTVTATWRSGSTCASRPCEGEGEMIFTTGGINMASLSECENYGYCSYPDGTVTHDMLLTDCEGGGDRPTTYVMTSTSSRATCAITSDAELECFGQPSANLANVPTGRFIDVSVDGDYGCAVRETGELACWRWVASPFLNLGQDSPPSGTYTAVALSQTSGCALHTSGELECWGSSNYQLPNPTHRFDSITGGYNRHCGITQGSALVLCWGEGVSEDYPLSDFPSTQVVTSGFLGVCALRATGAIACGQMNPTGFSPTTCPPGAMDPLPSGTFTQLAAQGDCGGCGLRSDGSVECWGDAPTGRTFSGPLGYVSGWHRTDPLCGVLTDGTLDCVSTAYTVPRPAEPTPSGTFNSYACRTITESEVTGWQGDGCHPLQHGFASACGCATDSDCVGSETCDTDLGRCVSGGAPISCVCSAGSCPSGRVCSSGACAAPCSTSSDCATGRECTGGVCTPPAGVPYAESIVHGMQNVGAPAHLVSTYAMSELLTTLILRVNLYVEASFKLFKKERRWRIFEFDRGYDLGSSWRGWYQPGLEALYHSECANPDLDDPVTNRFPRSLTSNSFDGVFNNPMVDAIRHCLNGGVCRYPNPLPASFDRPEQYPRGNAGDVHTFLDWCINDMPQHAENPAPSSNDDITNGIVDTGEWGVDIALEIWQRNQICVDGVVVTDWIDSLDPKFDEDGNLIDPGLMSSLDCTYEDPRTGDSHVFPCEEITEQMLRIWGCLDVSGANPFSIFLANAYPGALTTDPTTGATIFDLDALFDPVMETDPVFGDGMGFPYTLDAMKPHIRFHVTSSPFFITRLGERWLERVDVCFGDRFEDPAESTCGCATDADCAPEYGERCNAGVCEQGTVYDPTGACINASCSTVWTQKECPIVFVDIQPGPCCGDGIVQNTPGYTEECDDGPTGSATCTSDCEIIPTANPGACCTPGGGCFENLDTAGCSARGGTFYAGSDCAALDYCPDDGGGTGPGDDRVGACCTATTCLENMTQARCAVIGTWHPERTCAEISCGSSSAGACCTRDGQCHDGVTSGACEPHGTHYPNTRCREINYCRDDGGETGVCCPAEGGCLESSTPARCEALGGTFTLGGNCASVNFCRDDGGETGVCCTADGGCLESSTPARCEALGGAFTLGGDCASVNFCRDDGGETGVCCTADGGCLESSTPARCEALGGTFTLGGDCASVNFCRPGPGEGGACCVSDGCFDDADPAQCERALGSFYPTDTCATIDHCRDDSATYQGACCLEDRCIEDTPQMCYEQGGVWNYQQTCDDVNHCGFGPPEPTGACCIGDACVEDFTERQCAARRGTFHNGRTCEEVNHCRVDPGDVGACCLPDGYCIDGVTEEKCDEEEGRYNPGLQCGACQCDPFEPGVGSGGGGGCTASPGAPAAPLTAFLVLGAALLSRRRSA